jgi:hypothetical protein
VPIYVQNIVLSMVPQMIHHAPEPAATKQKDRTGRLRSIAHSSKCGQAK